MERVVVCVGTSHPGNVGAVARVAANFGVTDLRFVAPRCDVHSKEALDRSVHARQHLLDARVVDDLGDALAGTSLAVGTTARITTAENRFLRKTLDARSWVASLDLDGTIALVFGREDTGLLAEEVNQLDQLVTIPTADYASLNLAHAVGVLCYETWRARAEDITPPRALAPDTLQAMNAAWDDLVDCCDGRTWRREVAKGMWRKIMGRSLPDDHEVHNIMGILTNALKRFDHPDWRTEASSRTVREHGLLAEPAEEE